MSDWDKPESAAYYEAFCRRHSRYSRANSALIAHACIAPNMRLLDLAAGTGRTADAALRALGSDGSILCVEPSAVMRSEGMRRVTDDRVQWRASLADASGSFDRILCGAAIWQLNPLPEAIAVLARLLRTGGALCFNIPAAYLLEPDEPGGGQDPALLSLPTLLSARLKCVPADTPMDDQSAAPLSHRSISGWLRAAGLCAELWCFRLCMTQQAYADWLKIPVTTNRLLAGLSAKKRAEQVEAALRLVDRSSWKWERWHGWTAWKE